MSLPPWPDWTADQWRQAVRALKFDESKVVRSKEKGHEGEFAHKAGMTYAPDPGFITRTKEYIEATYISRYQDQEYQRTRGEEPVISPEDVPLEALKSQATAAGRAMLARAVPTVRVPDFVAIKILTDGRFKSQHESGHSKGVLDPAYRVGAEKTMFGTELESDVTERPIYGLFIEDFAEAQRNQGRSYGDAIFVLKDSVLDRTTVLLGDSLSESYHSETIAPRPYRDFDWVGTGSIGTQLTNEHTVDTLFSYVEAQFHGGVTLADVKEVMVPHQLYEWWSQSGTLAKFKEAGIPVRVISPGPHKARV